MAFQVKDRVQQTATANTTVSFTLTGTVTGFQTFATALVNGDTTYYAATDASGNWEVGEGTFSTTGPTLTRTSIIDSNAGGAAITFVGTVTVFITYPAYYALFINAIGEISQPVILPPLSVWNGSTIGVSYGGTGVTSSSGADSVMLRDANQNVAVNRLNQSNTNTTAAGGTTALTAASSYIHTLSGTGNQTYTMPNATTLSTGVAFLFNNMATGTLTLQNFAAGAIGTIPPGGAGAVFLTINSTVGGTWDLHSYLPEGVTWGTNALNLSTAIVSGGTWQGGTIQSGYGGTGLTTFAAANNALYSTSASALVAGTLPVAAGGTAATTFTANGVLYGNTTSALGVTAAGTTGQVLIGNTGAAPSWGTISSSLVSSITFGTTGLTPATATTGAVTVAGTLAGTNGGTGQSTYAIGDLLQGAATNTLSKLAAVATGNALISGGVTTASSWGKIGLTTHVSGTLAATSGGTGQSTYAVGDILVGGATNTLSKLADVATGSALISGGVGVAPSYGKIGLTTHVSGTLPVANGGTGVTASTGSTTLVLATSPTFTTSIDGGATFGAFASSTALTIGYTGTGAASTTNISTAALTGVFAKTINIGTNGTTSSTTGVNINTSVGGTTRVRGALLVGNATSSTTDGAIYATNNITAFAASDIKFKTNIKTIANAVEKVQLIGGKTFDWTDEYIKYMGGEDSYFMRKSDAGVIAQDVHKVIPELTRERKDGSLAVDYPKLVALAFAAIVELKAEIDELKKDK